MHDESDAGNGHPDDPGGGADAGGSSEAAASNEPGDSESLDGADDGTGATVGEYDWATFEEEVFYEDGSPPTNWRGKPRAFDPATYLGHDPDETGDRVEEAAETGAGLRTYFETYLDPEETSVAVGEYLWEHFKYEHYYERDGDADEFGRNRPVAPRDEDGNAVPFDRSEWLGHDDLSAGVFEAGAAVTDLSADFEAWLDPETTPVTKGEYYWEHFKYEYYYEDTEVTAPERPRDRDGQIERFDEAEWLGFPEENLEDLLAQGAAEARTLREVEDERTLDVPAELDEDAFFSTVEGHTTVVNRYDLEKAVALPKKDHFREIDRYWVNKPYAFVVLFHSAKENETKYYLVEPYCTPIETDLKAFLEGKLRSAITYASDDVVVEADADERGAVVERETLRLLDRYDLYAENDGERARQLRDLLDRYDRTRDALAGTGDAVGEYLARAREEADEAVEPLRAALDERRGDSPNGSTREAASDSPTDGGSADEEVAPDGGAVGDDGEAGSGSGQASPDSPDGPESVDAPTEDWGESDPDESRDAEAVPSDSASRLGDPLDLSVETAESLRRRVRAAIEARIEAMEPDESGGLDGIAVRPEPVLLEEDDDTLSEYQTEKLLYYLRRDFTGYERIDGVKHDINVEDISVDGYNSPVFVYHTDYEQVITNVYHGEDELDDFVVKLAQRSGKGISKRQPQVDATLPDGSRAQLTLGREVSDHGTNYTIRQFKDVPFTPIDLVNWNTFSLEQMAFLWLAIENHKSLIFAGGTASGKTTSLNAVSLFIPSNTKIVSIEDTREVELPQRNWIASVTRPSFSDDDKGDVDEFDLLEAALRQRPDYIVMGEIRGEEGRTLFQVMSTGHTTYTTFHADTVGEVLKRFTTEPINVSKTLFTALDLVSIQTQTRVQGSKVRRNKSLTEINEYSAENDEINVQDIFQWRAEDDEFMRLSGSNTMEDIMFDRGWDRDRLEREILKRRVILAYLIRNGLEEYAQVAATVQAFINDPDTILTLIANGKLEESLEDLREMESVHIDVDPKKEEMVPRPDPSEETYALAKGILAEADDGLLEEYRGADADVEGLAVALAEGNESTPRDSSATPSGPPDDEVDRDPDARRPPDAESEPATDAERVTDAESATPEDSVRDTSEGGELGRFPDSYDRGDEPDGESGGPDGGSAEDSFGDFEAAFDGDSEREAADGEEATGGEGAADGGEEDRR
ncbi:ATPase, T2SS/T4P/T4SS family [Halorussus halobius]|uniref:ATPase, T2SS/T4P/T4SS family n=1 Tax=Halorussus halobius TaxID=1710537 RepID=UPI001FCF0675|nr:ATPase, T2SS/T4P/T4SS family [Halorussus halobius]